MESVRRSVMPAGVLLFPSLRFTETSSG